MNTINKQKQTQLEIQSNMIFDALVSESDNKVLPESFFKEHFLPFFSGVIPVNNKNKMLTYWIGIAGTPTNEVDIVDDNTGELLFTVPPVVNTTSLNVKASVRGESYWSMLDHHSLLSNNAPHLADSFLNKALESKINADGDVVSNIEVASDKWNIIFKRYGIKTPVNNTTNTLAEESDDDDLLEY